MSQFRGAMLLVTICWPDARWNRNIPARRGSRLSNLLLTQAIDQYTVLFM